MSLFSLLQRVFLVVAWMVLGVAHAAEPARAASASAGAPESAGPSVAASEFYQWYVQALSRDKDPLSDDPAGMARYVSAPLIREIKARINSPDGLEADYFIQAQDYSDDWLTHVTVASPRLKGDEATTTVTLGSGRETMRRLSVTLVKEGTRWKIRRVRSL